MVFDEESYSFISKLVSGYRLPRMARVHQSFDGTMIEDIAGTVENELGKPEIRAVLDTFSKGDTVALTAGSRQVRNLSTVIKTVVGKTQSLPCSECKYLIFPHFEEAEVYILVRQLKYNLIGHAILLLAYMMPVSRHTVEYIAVGMDKQAHFCTGCST